MEFFLIYAPTNPNNRNTNPPDNVRNIKKNPRFDFMFLNALSGSGVSVLTIITSAITNQIAARRITDQILSAENRITVSVSSVGTSKVCHINRGIG
jgi:hypothetical protein